MLKGFRKLENGLPRCFLVCKKRTSLFCFRVLPDFHTPHAFRELSSEVFPPWGGSRSPDYSPAGVLLGDLFRWRQVYARVRQAFFVFLLSLCHFYPATFWVIAVCGVTDGVFLLSLICHLSVTLLPSSSIRSVAIYQQIKQNYTVFCCCSVGCFNLCSC